MALSIDWEAVYAGGPLPRGVPYARRLDPMTGDVVFDHARGTWAAGSPMAEVALRVVRTRLGTAARDPSYGVDYAQVEAAGDNAPAVLGMVIERAFRRWIDRGEMTAPDVEAEAQGTALVAEVSFRDRAGGLVTLRGRSR